MKVTECQHDGFRGADALVRLRLSGPGGESITMRFSRLFKLENAYHIIGSQGSIRGRLFSWNKYEERVGSVTWREVQCNEDSPTRYEEFVVRMTDQFITCIQTGLRPFLTIEDVVPSIEVLDAAYEMSTLFELPWYTEWKE